MKKALIIFTTLALFFSSCNKVVEKTKSTINKGGEAVGGSATEFFDGVSNGVNKTLECDLSISDDLKQKGIESGTFSIENDKVEGRNNVLVLYLVYNKDFESELTAKAYNKKGLEIGRAKLNVSGKSGNAEYIDFKFDPRTYIGNRFKIKIE